MIFVLVPGGWYGASVYDDVTRRLRARGHRVYPVTLSGLDVPIPPSASRTSR